VRRDEAGFPVKGGARAPWIVASVVILLALGAFLAAPAETQAQSSWSASGGAGVHFQYFDFSDPDAANLSSISLVTVPVSARVRAGGPFRVEAVTTFARGELSRPGGENVTISGLTDTQFRVLVDLLQDRVTLSAAVDVPTGADGFTAEEAGLAGAVAADLLPFRISSWGTGGGVGGGVSLFQPMGAFGLGLSVGYMAPGEFTPISDAEFQYRPGPALRIQGVVDYTVGQAGRAALQLGYHRYGDDEVEGQNLFRTGDRLQARASYSFAAGTGGSAVVYAGYLHRSEGTFLEELEPRPSQGLMYAGAGLRHPMRGMVLVPTAELRIQRRDDGRDQGTLAGVGASLEIPVQQIQVIPHFKLRGGSVQIRDGVDSGVLGVELGASVRHGGSR